MDLKRMRFVHGAFRALEITHDTEESLSRKSSSDIIKTTFFYLIFCRKNAFKTLSPERKFQKRFIIDKYENIMYYNNA